MSVTWNPWHGCHKISAGCMNCYVYRQDAKWELDSSQVYRTKSFDLPIKRGRNKEYKIAAGTLVYTCFTSDFFLEEADQWRDDAWKMIKERQDLHFLFITKRIHRFLDCIPSDWGKGYPNVTVCCTVENQDRADFRLPIYFSLPLKERIIICEPLLEKIDLSPYLDFSVKEVIAGGESGNEARPCDYEWVLDIRRQCEEKKINFHFKQTGARFIKDQKHYRILRKDQHKQAKKANIDLHFTN